MQTKNPVADQPLEISTEVVQKISSHLERIYKGIDLNSLARKLCDIAFEAHSKYDRSFQNGWDESSVFLISYGDQLRQADKEKGFRVFYEFAEQNNFSDLFSTLHFLPFYPYTCDDGFGVSDFSKVRDEIGDWTDAKRFLGSYSLMYDFVLNHVSGSHPWVKGYLSGDEAFKEFCIDLPPSTELSEVVRPRSTPLLTEFSGNSKKHHLWTTFSDDQVDLNYANPIVLEKMVGVLFDYISKGASVVRIDAVGFLWKELGTNCIHRPQTHEVVKLMRSLVEAFTPGVILLTETNVPHKENISYFGENDEAQMVYQFSLAPLIAESLMSGKADYLASWAETVSHNIPGRTYLNFTASHDGVGVRPVEDLLPKSRKDAFFQGAKNRKGFISTKSNSDGTTSPYELNITYFDLIAPDTANGSYGSQCHVDRFIASQAIMLSMKGVPAVYFHSLFASPSDFEGFEKTGRARTVNRKQYDVDELQTKLNGDNCQAQVFKLYSALLRIRRQHKAFHPDALQEIVDLKDEGLFAIVRGKGSEKVVCVFNVSADELEVTLSGILSEGFNSCLWTGEEIDKTKFTLKPYQFHWLKSIR